MSIVYEGMTKYELKNYLKNHNVKISRKITKEGKKSYYKPLNIKEMIESAKMIKDLEIKDPVEQNEKIEIREGDDIQVNIAKISKRVRKFNKNRKKQKRQIKKKRNYTKSELISKAKRQGFTVTKIVDGKRHYKSKEELKTLTGL